MPKDLKTKSEKLRDDSPSQLKTSSDSQAQGKEIQGEKGEKSSEKKAAQDEKRKAGGKTNLKEEDQQEKFSLPGDLEVEIKSLKKDIPSADEVESSKVSFDLDAFERSLSILEREFSDSDKYKKEVHSLETSFYNDASLGSLEVLSDIFDKKDDRTNKIRVLETIAANYPEIPKGHYLLGVGYKKIYFESPESHDKAKKRAVESFSQAIKLERRYQEAYQDLLPLLIEEGHTPYSLELIKDMVRYFRDPKHYSLLCAAYYENNFFKQTRKACAKAIEEDSQEPTNYLLLAFVQEKEKDIKKRVEEVAERFSHSYDVQFKTGVFFLNSSSVLAIKYFKRAVGIQAHSHRAQSHLGWLLFKADQIEKAYEHFFQSCIHSRGKTMKAFQKAEMSLRYKQTSSAAKKWRKGIADCFQSLKEKSKKTKAGADVI